MRDALGIVPPHIKANYEREEMIDRQLSSATALFRALQALDDRLDVVFISDRADAEYGVVPGRWHVVRKNPPPAPDSYMAITTPSGGYREPDSSVLTELQRRDLWKHGVPQREDKPSAYREPPKTDEGMIDELASDIRAGHRLPGDGGMTKKLWGRK